MRSNTIGRLCSLNCGMIQTKTTSSADGIGRRIMSTDEIHMMIREITTELAATPRGMDELRLKEQWEVFNARLEMARMKNHLLMEIGQEPIRYNDIELAQIAGVTPENIRHIVRNGMHSFQKKVGPKCRREMEEQLQEVEDKRIVASDEPQGGDVSILHWDEAEARARMGGNN